MADGFHPRPQTQHPGHPTLIVWGRDDKVNKPSGAEMLARRMPNADVLVTANTGHWVQWERAEFFNAVTTAFLS